MLLAGPAGPASAASLTCSAGSYLDGSTNTCVPASPGYCAASDGAISKTPCPAGTYQPYSGSASCLIADPG